MNEEIAQKLENGYLLIRSIIEVVGKPETYVEESLKSHLEKIRQNKSFDIVKTDVEKPEKNENYVSAFAEIEMFVKIDDLFRMCFEYMPSSIEIIEPQSVSRNFMVLLFRGREMSVCEMKPFLGIKEIDIKKVLHVLSREGKVKKHGDKYKAVPNERLQKSG